MARRSAGPARDPPLRRPVRPPGERRLPRSAAREARDCGPDRCACRSRRRAMAAQCRAPARRAAARRRATPPIRKRSTPTLWCANGSASGSGRRTKRRGRRRTAGSTTICATRRTRAKRRRWPISRRSITPSPTAAAPGDTRRRWTKSTRTAFAGGYRTVNLNSMRPTYWAPTAATSRRSLGSSTSLMKRRPSR